MDSNRRIFDDVARVAGGAFETLAGVREEIEGLIRHQIDRMLSGRNLVTRDEFDAVQELAAATRAECDLLQKRVAELEARAAGPARKPAKPAPRGKRKRRPAADAP